LYKVAKAHASKPVKVSVGAGPINLALARALQALQGREGTELRARADLNPGDERPRLPPGAKYLQLEDLGAWLPLFTGNKDDYKWIREVVEQCCDGVDARIGWHFCFGNAWGNDILSAAFPTGYQTVLPYFFGTAGIDEFVLDYANREMDGVEFLKNLPANQGVQIGVLDIRTNAIEKPEKIAERIRKVVKNVPADKVTLSTDCGMKPLARMVAKMKLNSLAEGAAIVRKEVAGV
jgi:5-methyltetrahydropteroyltriglutamate--homocysteine methyltransferase